jgi:hypothetical protein
VPVPFLAVYAVLFIVHGKFHPVIPPDITSSQSGEFTAGLIALVLFVVAFVAVIWMLNGVRRWPFALVQAAVIAGAADLVVDSTRGGGLTGSFLVAAAAVALVLAYLPPASEHVRGRGRRNRRRHTGRTGRGRRAVPRRSRSQDAVRR